MWTDGQTEDMTKLMVTFRYFAITIDDNRLSTTIYMKCDTSHVKWNKYTYRIVD
jgi:hypothetical protein